jgi:hypothetical protein|tara:strand:+ start:3156 stop:3413 length:258 start_codon:yes stop_codon:yes gene_type:complete
MSSYTSYTPARINDSNCNDDNKKCPKKVLPINKPKIENTQNYLYASILKNSQKRKKTVFLSQNRNEYNKVSGSFGGSGSPPRNKF